MFMLQCLRKLETGRMEVAFQLAPKSLATIHDYDHFDGGGGGHYSSESLVMMVTAMVMMAMAMAMGL